MLAGLERAPVNDDSGFEIGDDSGVEVALSLGRSPRQEHQIGVFEGSVERFAESRLVVPKNAQEARLRAELAYGIGQDATVAVEDEAGAHAFARLNDLVTRGENGNSGPADDRHFTSTNGRQDPGLPGGQLRAAEEHGLTPADVRARKRHSGARNSLASRYDPASIDVGEFDR
jgi:hypothetical protein